MTVWSERQAKRRRCCSRSGYCRAILLFVGCSARPGRIRTPAPPLRRSIGGQGLRGYLRPGRPAKWGVHEVPPRFLPLRRHRFQSQLSCCRGSREEVFSYPRLCWLGAARQLNPISISKPSSQTIRRQSRSRKSAQDDRWSFCLTAGTLWPANQERP